MERCPDTGRLHCQCYLRYKSAVAVSTVRALVKPGHVEVCAGDEASNIKYCTKEESRVAGPWELGERSKQGKRKDIDVVRETVLSGGGMAAVVRVATSFQGMRAGELMLKHCERGWDRSDVREVRWYHGETGGGKTKRAFDEFESEKKEDERMWVSGKDLRWFNEYDAHEWCLVDDFRKDFCTFHMLLRLFDRYPFVVETKGGFRQWLARVIIVTCPWSPSELYSSRTAEDVQQLLRRITLVECVGQPVPTPAAFSAAPNFRQ